MKKNITIFMLLFLMLGVVGCDKSVKKDTDSTPNSNNGSDTSSTQPNEPISLKDLQDALTEISNNNNFTLYYEEHLDETTRIYDLENTEEYEDIWVEWVNRNLYYVEEDEVHYYYHIGSQFGEEWYWVENNKQYVGAINGIGQFDDQIASTLYDFNPFDYLDYNWFELLDDESFSMKDEYLNTVMEDFTGDYSYDALDKTGMKKTITFNSFKIFLNSHRKIEKLYYEFNVEEIWLADAIYGDTIFTQIGNMTMLVEDIGTTNVVLPTESYLQENELQKAIKNTYATENFTYTQTGKSDIYDKTYIYGKDGKMTHEYSYNGMLNAEANRYTYYDEEEQKWYGLFENDSSYDKVEQLSYAVEMLNPLNYIHVNMFELVDGYYQPKKTAMYFAGAIYTSVYNKYYSSVGGCDIVEFKYFKIKLVDNKIDTIDYKFNQTEYYWTKDNFYSFDEEMSCKFTDFGTTIVVLPTI